MHDGAGVGVPGSVAGHGGRGSAAPKHGRQCGRQCGPHPRAHPGRQYARPVAPTVSLYGRPHRRTG